MSESLDALCIDLSSILDTTDVSALWDRVLKVLAYIIGPTESFFYFFSLKLYFYYILCHYDISKQFERL